MAVESINTIKSYLTEGKYPTASELVGVIDTLVSIGQNSGGDTSGLAAVAISGDYNDLTNKPTIPTVPAISTNITSDATSDTKTASPKAVKDFVESKGYLTQHQDISSKANQTDLEALEDRVETLEQSGSGSGDTTQYSYLKLIPDLDVYTEAPVGEIVKYTGQSNNKYTRGWDYEKKEITLEQGLYITSIDYPTPSSSGVRDRQAALQTAFENFDFTSLKATNETGKMYIIKNVNDTPFYSTEPTLSVGSKLFETIKGRECEIKSETSNYYIVNNWGLENPDATNENNQIRKNFSVQTINVPKFRDNSGNEVWVYTNDDLLFYFPNLEWTMESYGTTIQQNRYIVVDRTYHDTAEVNYQNVQEPSVIPSWQPIIYPSVPVSSGN